MKKLVILFFTCLVVLYALPCAYAFPPADGRYKELYTNGKVKEEGYYKKGQKNKIWLYYNENGLIQKKEKWKDGALQWTVLYENGKISTITDKKGNVKERPKCGC